MDNLVTLEDGARLYVEIIGAGKPLLLIPGLGTGNWLWSRSSNELAGKFRLIMPELRGSGRSDKPDHPYSVEMFAADMKALLDILDVRKAGVLGASLGGLVAQYLAATWRERVEKLILVATAIGGPNQTGPKGEILNRMIKPRGRSRKERLEDAYDLSFTAEFMRQQPQELDRITDWRLTHPQPEFAYYRQLLAGNAYNGENVIAKISAPTLIMAGEQDQLVPIDDVRNLQRNLPSARLVTFPGKHLFFYEQNQKFNQVIIDFLET